MASTNWLVQILPLFLGRSEVKKISARIESKKKKLDLSEDLDPTWQKYLRLTQGNLEDALRAELSRREGFQRKALSFLSSVAVMCAFAIGSLNLARLQHPMIPKWVLLFGIVATLAYLASSALSSLKLLSIDALFDLSLQNRMNGELPFGDDDWKIRILHLIQYNQAFNLLLATYSKRAYFSLRNGVLALMASICLLAANALSAT